ncbi:uncharacterized protein LOC125025301 [Penaeus chinensis]|uniref:uncharacterized protein LOC125025301 n=1 Tax=Penaeus chinensis TaxID=139456 RepID=UPI001FB5A337|nr:uncharacterized protein LOC125025301 [Penaeus chinensis]
MFAARVPVGVRLLLLPLLLCCVKGALPFPHGVASRMDAALPLLYRLALPRDLVAEEALPARDPVPELRNDDLLRLQALLRQLPSLYPVAAAAAPSSSAEFLGSPSKRQGMSGKQYLGAQRLCELDIRNCSEDMIGPFSSQYQRRNAGMGA